MPQTKCGLHVGFMGIASINEQQFEELFTNCDPILLNGKLGYVRSSPIRLPACNGENLLPLVIIVSMCKIFSPERVARVTLYKSIVLNG